MSRIGDEKEQDRVSGLEVLNSMKRKIGGDGNGLAFRERIGFERG